MTEGEDVDERGIMCEAGDWSNWTGQDGPCGNQSTHTEYWFDEEDVDVNLCDEHRKS